MGANRGVGFKEIQDEKKNKVKASRAAGHVGGSDEVEAESQTEDGRPVAKKARLDGNGRRASGGVARRGKGAPHEEVVDDVEEEEREDEEQEQGEDDATEDEEEEGDERLEVEEREEKEENEPEEKEEEDEALDNGEDTD